ncbi:MAG TPA: glycosyltransferase, partial [Polyangiales bacterium]|nr:glycosyltransferase [Polyangiales bacterium]
MQTDVVIVASHGDSLITFRGDLLQQMRARGLGVLAVAPALTGDARTWLAREGIEFREAPLARTGRSVVADLRFWVWLRATLRDARPKIVLAYTVKPVVYGMLAALGTGARRYALITGLGYAFTDGAGDRRLIRLLVEQLYRVALRAAHTVFFQNPDDERFFRERGLIPDAVPSLVLPGSGIDVQLFVASDPPAGPVVFLMIARLLGDKGVREYVAAVRSLRESHPQVRARLVGWIDENPDAIK